MEKYTAHIEPLASIIRVFKSEDSYGEEYLWCCTIRWINPMKVELCGVIRFPNFEFRHTIGKTLWKMGVKEVIFTRKKDNQERTVVIDVDNMAKREKWADS